MTDKKLTSIFTRVGNKNNIKNQLYKYFPDDFQNYVEPFVGGGSVFMGYSFKENQKIVINDLETNLIKSYKFIQSNPSIIDTKEKFDTREKSKLETLIKNGKGKDGIEGFVYFCIYYANSYGGKGCETIAKLMSVSPYYRIKRIPEQAKKLKNITILNEDGINVINKYNTIDTFLYIDPPYENSKTLYKNYKFNYEKLLNVLKKFKGKWLLSVNSSENIKNIFSDYQILEISVNSGGNGNTFNKGIGCYKRNEFIIKNYL